MKAASIIYEYIWSKSSKSTRIIHTNFRTLVTFGKEGRGKDERKGLANC
jgi:hypothetical protein